MPTNTLTNAAIRAAKPADKAQKLLDGGGLVLFVSPKGAEVWRLAYRVAGKAQTATIGSYPLIGLADARRRRDELKLLEGELPQESTVFARSYRLHHHSSPPARSWRSQK